MVSTGSIADFGQSSLEQGVAPGDREMESPLQAGFLVDDTEDIFDALWGGAEVDGRFPVAKALLHYDLGNPELFRRQLA